MYPASNGFGLTGGIDYSQCFGPGLSARSPWSGPGSAAYCLDHADSARFYAGGLGAGAWPAQPGVLLSDTACTQFCAADLKTAAARRRTLSDDVRFHPYGRRFAEFASWPELRQSAAAYDVSHAVPHFKLESVIKEELSDEGQHVPTTPVIILTVAEKFLALELRLCDVLRTIQFPAPITHIYNPLEYAMVPHRQFIMTYCNASKDVLFLGINPGPFGMAQTGVPFGEVNAVKNWLRISGVVYKPNPEHPKRPVWGLQCTRSEVSGARFWKLLQQLSVTPENFFRRCFVHNMCPLLFMCLNGKNLTPPDLPADVRRQLNSACDRALVDVARLLAVRTIVAVGKYAQCRARTALRDAAATDVDVAVIMHPSPASPAANKAWSEIALTQLTQAGLLQYFQ